MLSGNIQLDTALLGRIAGEYGPVLIACESALAPFLALHIHPRKMAKRFAVNSLCAKATMVNAAIQPIAFVGTAYELSPLLAAADEIVFAVVISVLVLQEALGIDRPSGGNHMDVRIIFCRGEIAFTFVNGSYGAKPIASNVLRDKLPHNSCQFLSGQLIWKRTDDLPPCAGIPASF